MALDCYEVILEITQTVSLVIEAGEPQEALNRALLEQAGSVPIYEDTREVEFLGRSARHTLISKLRPDDPRHAPKVRN